MGALDRILAIAGNTAREAIRSRVLYVLLFFALALIGSGVLLSTLSYVERDRIFQDVALAAIRVFGVAIAIFVGIGLVHREVDRRTVFTILSKPIARGEIGWSPSRRARRCRRGLGGSVFWSLAIDPPPHQRARDPAECHPPGARHDGGAADHEVVPLVERRRAFVQIQVHVVEHLEAARRHAARGRVPARVR